MNKLQVYEFLDNQNIWYEKTEHEAVFNMQELSEIVIPYPEADAKNLFVRDDKRQNYYLISVKGNKRVNLKDFRRKLQTRPLTFASPEDLMGILGLIPGAVSPLGVLNDKNHIVKVFLDKEFIDNLIGIHPNDNTATVCLKTTDLITIIKNCGNFVDFVDVDNV